MTMNRNEFVLAVRNVRVERFLVEIQIRDNSIRVLLSDKATRILPGVCRGWLYFVIKRDFVIRNYKNFR
jgi:hypothetical protein